MKPQIQLIFYLLVLGLWHCHKSDSNETSSSTQNTHKLHSKKEDFSNSSTSTSLPPTLNVTLEVPPQPVATGPIDWSLASPSMGALIPSSGVVHSIPTQVTVSFDQPMQPPPASAFEISGTCLVLPRVAAAQLSADASLLTATLSGGQCKGQDIITLKVSPLNFSNRQGVAGSGVEQAVTYTLNSIGPTTDLHPMQNFNVPLSKNTDFSISFTYSENVIVSELSENMITLTPLTSTQPTCAKIGFSQLTAAGGLVTFSNCSGDGTFTFHLNKGSAKNSLGNEASQSTESPPITIDNTAPTIKSLTPAGGFFHPLPSQIYLTFSEEIPAIDPSTFSLEGTCQTLPSIQISQPDPKSAILSLFNGSCADKETLSLFTNSLTDTAGNHTLTSLFLAEYTLVTTGPKTTLDSRNIPSVPISSKAPSFSIPFTYDTATTIKQDTDMTKWVTFSGQSTTPSCIASISTVTNNGGTLLLSQCTGDGVFTVHINAATAFDAVENPSILSQESSPIHIKNTPPTIIAISPSSGYIGHNQLPTLATISFNSPIQPAALQSIPLDWISVTGDCLNPPRVATINIKGNDAIAMLEGGDCLDTQSFTLQTTPNVVADLAGNVATDTISATYTMAAKGPSTTIGTPSTLLANKSTTVTLPFSYSIAKSPAIRYNVFSDSNPVIGLVPTYTNTATCTVTVTPGDLSNPLSGGTITLSQCQGDGTVSLQIVYGTVVDALNNLSIASNSSEIVSIDNTAPSVISPTIMLPRLPASVTFQFSEPILGQFDRSPLSTSQFINASVVTTYPQHTVGTPFTNSSSENGITSVTFPLTWETVDCASKTINCSFTYQLKIPTNTTDLIGNPFTQPYYFQKISFVYISPPSISDPKISFSSVLGTAKNGDNQDVTNTPIYGWHLSWNAATDTSSGQLQYSVYYKKSATLADSAATLLQSGLTTTSYDVTTLPPLIDASTTPSKTVPYYFFVTVQNLSTTVSSQYPQQQAPLNKYVYFVIPTQGGDFLAAGKIVDSTVTTGIAGADALCKNALATQSYLPSGTKVKAFLVDGTNRNACTTVDCKSGEEIDWVLTSDTHYFYPTGLEMGTTANVTTVPIFAKSNTFDTTIHIGSSPGITNRWVTSGEMIFYTGFGDNLPWNVSKDTCDKWKNNINFIMSGFTRVGQSLYPTGYAGAAGDTNVYDPNYYYNGKVTVAPMSNYWSYIRRGCDMAYSILCIQQ